MKIFRDDDCYEQNKKKWCGRPNKMKIGPGIKMRIIFPVEFHQFYLSLSNLRLKRRQQVSFHYGCHLMLLSFNDDDDDDVHKKKKNFRS